MDRTVPEPQRKPPPLDRSVDIHELEELVAELRRELAAERAERLTDIKAVKEIVTDLNAFTCAIRDEHEKEIRELHELLSLAASAKDVRTLAQAIRILNGTAEVPPLAAHNGIEGELSSEGSRPL